MASQQKSNAPVTMNEAVTQFTCELYKKVCGGKSDNAIMSPYSVSAALMLAMLGTEGNSKQEIMEALSLSNIPTQNIHEEYTKLKSTLTDAMDPSTTMAVANRVFAKTGLDLKNAYKDNSKKFYGSETEVMDFGGNPEGSRSRINTWVEDQTNKKIKDLIPAGSIDGLTLVILVNAIYFKGEWDQKFKSEKTMKKDFRMSDTDVKKVDMMHADKDEFLCCESSEYQCKALELPYKGRQMSMLILLPDSVSGLGNLEEQLSLTTLKTIKKNLRRRDALISLPKFKIEMTAELQKVLPLLGITDIFDQERADLSGMIENPPAGTRVSDVIHKAFIEVNEEGTEAAAATGMMIRALCMPPPPLEFTADHPFLFLIVDKRSDTVLFIGRYSQPKEE